MRSTAKDVARQTVKQFAPEVYKTGTFLSFNPRTYTATVILDESDQVTLRDIPISRTIPSRALMRSSRCLLMTPDPGNPQSIFLADIISGRSMYPNVVYSFYRNATQQSNNNTAVSVAIPSTRLRITTGPTKVMVTYHGAFYVSDPSDATSGGLCIGIDVEVKTNATEADGTVTTTTTYYPRVTPVEEGDPNAGLNNEWWVFVKSQLFYLPVSFSFPVDVSEGVHDFVVRFRPGTTDTTVHMDINGNTLFMLQEL